MLLPVQVLSGKIYSEKSQEGNKSKFYLLVILLQGSHILSGFAELSFLHALANIPSSCNCYSPTSFLFVSVRSLDFTRQNFTSERRPSWHTSGRTCDPTLTRQINCFTEVKKRLYWYLAQASAMAVVFESIHTARCTCEYNV